MTPNEHRLGRALLLAAALAFGTAPASAQTRRDAIEAPPPDKRVAPSPERRIPPAGQAEAHHGGGGSALGIGAAIVGAAILAKIIDERRQQQVPALIGKSCDEARALPEVRRLELRVDCRPGQADGGQPPGRIQRQEPAPKAPLPATRELLAWVEADAPLLARPTPSPAPETAASPKGVEAKPRLRVPAVEGMSWHAASAALAKVDLAPRRDGGASLGAAVVKTQRPAAGTLVDPGASVALHAVLVVPDLRGLDCRAASRRARERGFDDVQCTNELRAEAALPLGRIFAQRPAPGRELEAAPALALSIAAASVPDVVGQPLVAARERIAADGLVARPDSEDGAADLEVAAQAPLGGTLYTEPPEVRLATRRMARVPPLVDLSCRQADAALLQAGLNSACHLMAQWLVLSEPRVFSQSIGAGARVGEGTLVTTQARAALWPLVVAGSLAALAALAALVVSWPRPRLAWRALRDPRPALHLRLVEPPRRIASRPPRLAWRVDADAGGAPLLRFG